MLGAGIVKLIGVALSSYTERWRLLLGILYGLIVIFLPRGLMGLHWPWSRRLSEAGSAGTGVRPAA